MRRKSALAALVCGLTLVGAGAAHAEGGSSVTLFGLLDEYVASYKPSGGQHSYMLGSGGMSTSFWGITGAEDIGGQWKIIFALSSFFRVNNGALGRSDTDPYFSRDSYVGVQSPFGTFTLGRQQNQSFRITSLFDPFGGSTAFSPLCNQYWTPAYNRIILGDTRWSSALGYVSPSIGGLTMRGIFGFNQTTGQSGGNNRGTSLEYVQGNFQGAAFYQHTDSGPGLTAQTPSQSVYFAGASYDFGLIKPMVSYGHSDTANVDTHTNTWSAGFVVPTGPAGRFNASVATTRQDGAAVASHFRHTTAGVGYDYFLSKRTDVYATALYDKVTNVSTGSVFAVGMRTLF
jgi:predicted porin